MSRPAPPKLKRWLLAGMAALLSACGFQLQGRAALPPQLAVTYVAADDPQSDFVQGLRKSLLAAGVRLAPQAATASAQVHVLSDALTRDTLSVSSRNLPREYQLTYTVRFSVSAGDRELLAAQEISASRDMTFDERTLLAKENEEAVLREALARDLVDRVMRQLASL
jgi:LPS-assembly lipoprotein